jgi:hypothetical protein
MKKMGQISKKLSLKHYEKLGLLAGLIIEFLATVLSDIQVDYHLGHKTNLKKKLREVFSIKDEFSEIREEWQKFYKTHFNWDVDFNLVIVPLKPPEGNWRLLFIARGMTMDFAFQVCKKLFKASDHTGYAGIPNVLDKEFPKHIRDTRRDYAIWVPDHI